MRTIGFGITDESVNKFAFEQIVGISQILQIQSRKGSGLTFDVTSGKERQFDVMRSTPCLPEKPITADTTHSSGNRFFMVTRAFMGNIVYCRFFLTR
jgi:hypothetical protein